MNKSSHHQNFAKTNKKKYFKLYTRLEKTKQRTMRIKLLNVFHIKDDSDFIFTANEFTCFMMLKN